MPNIEVDIEVDMDMGMDMAFVPPTQVFLNQNFLKNISVIPLTLYIGLVGRNE